MPQHSKPHWSASENQREGGDKMSERDGYQPGVPCWIACVHPDPEKAVTFYTELFGWEAKNLMLPGADGAYFLCKLRGCDVAAVVSQHGALSPPAPGWTTYIWVESADNTVAKVAEAGGCASPSCACPAGPGARRRA